jgi:hypothetical protein
MVFGQPSVAADDWLAAHSAFSDALKYIKKFWIRRIGRKSSTQAHSAQALRDQLAGVGSRQPASASERSFFCGFTAVHKIIPSGFTAR